MHSISIVQSAHSNIFISSYFSKYNCIVHSHVLLLVVIQKSDILIISYQIIEDFLTLASK